MLYVQTFLIIIYTLLGLSTLSSCSSSHAVQTVSSESLYDRVMQSGKIRCGYFIYPPCCMKDPNTGKLSGIFVDILNEAGKNLGLTIDWTEEVGAATMIEGLRANRYDLVPTGVWPNSSRGKYASFSTPLFYMGLCVYVRSSDNRFNKNLKAIDSKSIIIASIDGQVNQLIAERQFPHADYFTHSNMTDSAQILLDVATKKADVVLTEPGIATIFLKGNPGTVKNITKDKPIAIFANTMMFKIGESKFKSMLDTALTELINTGYVDTVLNKYEPKSKVYYRLANPYQQ